MRGPHLVLRSGDEPARPVREDVGINWRAVLGIFALGNRDGTDADHARRAYGDIEIGR